ncbi:MAG TPA: TMEM165/GDT1 family protein [Firmicutes bacterium]|nr:TMEM165/GDT1 family protein [Bacillota bacterium]HHY99438.1 TMEM165/GDT1 family protein [Bacillota bacterium]
MNWKLAAITFGLLFLAEIGDKTQLAVFTMVAQYKSPFSVFVGASAALIVVTLIGVIFGELVSRYVPVAYVQIAAGTFFLVMGVLILWRAVHTIIS